jgi:hypothetical protein
VYALVPVLGVVLLVLYADKETFAAKLLSTKVIVGIGLISYSAYLWHQPLFAFARIRSLEHPSVPLMLTLSSLSMALAYFSWRYIEKPFRNKNRLTRAKVFVSSAVLLVSFSLVGLVGHLNKGFQSRLDSSLLQVLEGLDEKALRLYGLGCYLGGVLPNPLPQDCGVNVDNDEIDVLLIGDSHLDSIGRQLLDRFEALSMSAYALSYGGCVPISGLNRADKDNSFQCVEYNEAVRNFAQVNSVKTIVLIGRFPLYLLGERYNNGEGGIENGNPAPVHLDSTDSPAQAYNSVDRIEGVLNRYRSDIQELTKKFNVVVFTPTPEVGWYVPKYYSKQIMFNSAERQSGISISHSYHSYLERSRLFNDMLSSIMSENLHVYDISKLFCTESTGRCVANIGNTLLYRDDNHLSSFAADIVADDFVDFYLGQINVRINE